MRKQNLKRKPQRPKHQRKSPQLKRKRYLLMTKFLLSKRRIRTQSTSKLEVLRTKSLLSTLIAKRSRTTKLQT